MLKILENFDFIDFNWECPYCKTKTTIVNGNCSRVFHAFYYFVLKTEYILCPNKDCKKITIKASLLNISDILIDSIDYTPIRNVHQKSGAIPIWEKTLQPDIPNAMALPEYIPESLRKDYYEAYKIIELSPKSSATLTRRCLQGMIRDFWSIKKSRLVDEIEELEKNSKIDEEAKRILDIIRKIGNKGAHLEKDVNLIIDIKKEDAKILLNLLEELFQNWYIAKHEKEERLKKLEDKFKQNEKIK